MITIAVEDMKVFSCVSYAVRTHFCGDHFLGGKICEAKECKGFSSGLVRLMKQCKMNHCLCERVNTLQLLLPIPLLLFCRGVAPRALSNGINSAVFFCFFEALRGSFKRRKALVRLP